MSEIELMRFVAGFAALITALEDLAVRPRLGPEGPNAWAVARDDWPRGVVRGGLDLLFSPIGLTMTLAARIVAAVTLLVAPHAFDAVVLALGTWVWAVRWRGTYNGGSDQMTLAVQIALAAWLAQPAWAYAACAGVAALLVTSYFAAGLAKVLNPAWRDGRAVLAIASAYGLRVTPARAKIIGCVVLMFELTFPLALTSPAAGIGFSAAGLVFHAVNAWALGLNRFLLAWAAAYPALYAVPNASGRR